MPVITLSNADKTFSGKPSLSSNLFGMGSNVIIGAVSDDDGISSIEYVIDKGTDKEISGTIDMSGKTPTSKSFQIDLTKLPKGGTETVISSGDHTLSIFATDISNGLENVSTPVKSSEETGVSEMAFGYDDDVPSLSVTTKSGELIGENISYSITGTAGDGSGLKKNSEGNPVIYRYAIDSTRHNGKYCSKEVPQEIPVSENGTWTDTIETDGNGDDFEYCAIDEYERSTTAKFTFRIDSVNPTITLTTPSEDTVYIGETTLYSFRGTADDPVKVGETTVDSSGITGIEYTVYASNGTETEQKTAAASTQWNININFDDYKDAETSEIDVSKIEFRSVDGGGLKSEPVSCSVIIDKISPVITAVVKQGGTVVEAVQNTYYTKSAPEVEITVFDENLENVSASKGSLMEKTPSETNPVYTLSGVTEAGEYVISATDKSGRTASCILNMYIDTNAPVIDISSVSPTVTTTIDGKSVECVNGTITVKGSVSDDESVKSTEFSLKQNGKDVTEQGVDVEESSNTNIRFEYKIDTTKLIDNTLLEIVVTSTDRAGNINTETKTITVNQDTDKPVISFSNIKAGGRAEENLFGMGGTVLFGSVTDDDGIGIISYTIDDNEVYKYVDMKSLTPTTKSFEIDLSKDFTNLSSGEHTVTVKAVDMYGKAGNEYTAYIAYDVELPKLSVTEMNGSAYSDNMWVKKEFTVRGSVSDDSGVAGVYEAEDTARATNLLSSGDMNKTSGMWSWEETDGKDGSGSKMFTAVDIFGREYSVNIQYKIDTIAPEFINDASAGGEIIIEAGSNKSNTAGLSGTWFTQRAVSISGTVKENDLDTLSIKDGKGTANSFTASGGSAGYPSYKTTYEFAKDGVSTFTLTAEDKAGNMSSIGAFAVRIDTVQPSLDSCTAAVDGKSGTVLYIKEGSKVTVTVSASDATSGVSKILVGSSPAFSESEAIAVINSTTEGAVIDEGSISGTVDISEKTGTWEAGTHTIYIRAVDRAGLSSSEKNFTLVVDKTAPGVEITSVSPVIESNSKENVNGTITVTGTSSDDDKVNSTILYINDKAVTNAYGTAISGSSVTVDKYQSSGMRVSYEIDTTKYADKEDIKIALVSTDRAGNTSKVEKTYYVDQDTDKPVISFSNIKADGSAEENLFGMGGTVLFGSVTDDDGIGIISYTIDDNEVYKYVDMKSLTPTTKSFEIDLSKDFTNLSSGEHTVTVKAVDMYGKAGDDYTANIAYDAELPKLSVTEINGTAYSDNMWVKKEFTVKGTASDDSGLSGIYESGDTERRNNLLSEGDTENKIKTWSLSTSGTDGNGDKTLTAVDIFGREYSVKIQYQIDTIAPVFINEENPSSKKIIIASGDKKADTATVSNVWFNQRAVSISGTVTEKNLDTLYLNGTAFTASTVSGENSGYKITSEFDEGRSNRFTLKAKDKAGNEISVGPFFINIDLTPPQIESCTLQGISKGDCINSETITVNFTVKDEYTSGSGSTTAGSGIQEIKISDSSTFNNVLAEWDASDSESVPKSLQINAQNFTVKTYELWIQVTDKAGNKTEQSISSFTYDKEPPKVKITSPADLAIVNKKITLTGTIDEVNPDASAENKPVLYMYDTSSSTGKWVAVDKSYYTSGIDAIGASWTMELDTEKISNTATDVTKSFFVAVKDKAGNINPFPEDDTNSSEGLIRKLVINQDSDRPVVFITNISLSGMSSSNPVWHKQNTITGTVSDDDGTIKELYISETPSFSSANLFKNGSWTYSFSDNGEKNIYFKVIDAKGTEFISKASSDLSSPKITDANELKFGTYGADSVIHIKVDTKEPTIPGIRYTTLDPSADLSGTNAKANASSILASDFSAWTSKGWKDINSVSSDVFGGDTSKIYVLINAKDDNGISLLTGSLTDLPESKVIIGNENLSENTAVEDIRFITFDISDLTSGTKTLSFNAKDNASEENAAGTTRDFSVVIDNDAPVVKFNSPMDNSSVYGTTSVTVRGETADSHTIKELYLAVSKSESDAPSDSAWIRISDYTSISVWTILFDGNSPDTGDIAYHASLLNSYINELYKNGSENNYADTVESAGICVWMYAVDMYNNTGKPNPSKLPLNVLTQGDKPTVAITYPSDKSTVGGTITITGSTTIAINSVDAVYLQIDPNYDESAGFNSNWAAAMSDLMDAKGITDYKIVNTGIAQIGSAIKANGSVQSWNLIINAGKELNKDDDSNRNIAVRCYAVSDTGKVSAPAFISFTLDPGSPVFGNKNPLRLVKYDASGNETASQMYEPGMWIKGEWYLTGSVEDDSGISSFKLDGIELIGTDKLEAYETPGTYSNYNLKIPVGSSTGYDSISYSLTAFEGAADRKSTVQEIKLNYDNEAPDFTCTTLSGTGNKIYQSDGVYEIKGTFKEESSAGKNQSGFDRIAFYFTRTIGGKTYIIDPMLVKGSDGKANRYDVASTTGLEKDSSDGMYWRKVENCTISNGKEISVTSIPDNVRAGGLCKINNVIYRIENVSGSTITVSSTLSSADSVTVYFAIAQIIDNTIRETGKTTFYGDSTGSGAIINDDGDGMVESYSETSGEWTVAINSQNILDGPIDIHFVAFDKAGNKTSSSYSGTVSNNTPRIAGIRLGTDLNGNNVVDNDELITVYSGLYDTASDNKITGVSVNGQKPNGEKVTSLDISDNGNAVMTIKGTSKFIPEIVGGNTSLGWSYAVDSVKHPFTKFTSAGHSDSDDVRDTATTTIELTMVDFLKDNVTDGENKKFTFSIWDETEGFTSGSDSQHADFNIVMNVAIQDKAKPTVHIKPFYWNSRTDNSIYKSDKSLKGHIELESDWKQTDSYKNNGTSAVYDGDPKVSGIILIEGVAEDNVILEKLEMCFPGLNNSSDYVTVAERNNGEWKSTLTLADNGIKFEIVKELFDNVSGNTLSYRIAVDTEKIKDVAKTDVQVRMRATDRGSASLSGNSVVYTSQNKSAEDSVSTTSENLSSYYRIDVVPYITGVKTYLGTKLKSSIVDAYSRSALGHYVVSADETAIELTGFNLGSNKTVDASSLTSGEYSVSVSNIESLNNKNNDNACGAYEKGITENSTYEEKSVYAYNRQPVEKSNHLLTDNIWFDVWEFDSDAAIPMSGKLSEPVMKINPTNGIIGFAFVSGPADFSMPHGNNDSYQRYQTNYATFSNVSLAFDDKGNSYGTATGLDTYPDGVTNTLAGRFTFMTSKWGPDAGDMNDNYNYENKLRLEAIGLPGDSKCYVKGTHPSTYTMTETRFASPSLAVASHESNTSVYLAYYDDIQGQIRFRYGSVCPGSKGDFDNFVDNEGLGNVASQKTWNGSGNERKYVFEANTLKFSLIAGADWQKYKPSSDAANGYTKQVVSKDGSKDVSNWFYDTGYNAGQYVAIDVIAGSYASNDKVVAVWYDGTDCWLGLNTNPASGKDNGVENGWSCKKIFSDGGEYCTVKTGPDGSIHIAANVDGSLKYAYIKNTSSIDSYNEETDSVTVDSFTITGEQINIDVGRKLNAQGKYVVVPYISYYLNSAKLPAVASLVIPDNGTMDYTAQGTVKDVFTGKWEVSPVPTPSTMSGGANDKVNVGLWKKTVGTVKGVIVKSSDMNSTTKGSNDSKTTYGNCYGNGTANPVLGYAIKTSSGTAIETAQLK
ncbi:Ig-like domain-containing protein [uncultured Treponema sp.]|uniref:Ig-like domain-containing protein n=1 Tax=uncultured Treponema sp. TaxID=162155 RepID=UPI0025965C3A|nr:Ig-like domain-containing protein [uncultured Treponema sp.]